MRTRRYPRDIHDAFVRRVFARTDTVSILLRHVLPPRCLAYLDLNTLELASADYTSRKLGRRSSDLLFTVRLRGTSRRIGLYIALEHQSTRDRLLPLRELEYLLLLWNRHRRHRRRRAQTLPFILPIVLLQRRAWTSPTRLSEIIDLPPEVLAAFGPPVELEMIADDLSRSVLDDPHPDRSTVAFVELARALLHAYRNPPAQTQERAASLVPLVETLMLDPKSSDDVITIWAYTNGVFKKGSPIHAALHRAINPGSLSMTDEDILMKPWIDKGMRKGLRKGRAEGMQKGRAEGMQKGRAEGMQKGRAEGLTEGLVKGRARSLLDVLDLRSLPMPPATRRRILSTKDEHLLERWFRRALAAASVEEIFAPDESLSAGMGTAK
ncbi:Rpn family recombination-promoting nuclease/putative transposase [Paraliomyxa miuraensis]|uniref:Rpn family recombination-promoting nuclease/putative transposase n=1 Tax=Paraliomyxa miuraensis TaxID=376150 RepID=UPI00224F6EB6|nr:Rpn family recombination-promoting nuclease/putative transposase [Paraliomyxa miuraensis]MCX4240560.1 Rpn family recombination-promoting nuclease/putative transposase [Paraliomyxa miuraensis]